MNRISESITARIAGDMMILFFNSNISVKLEDDNKGGVT